MDLFDAIEKRRSYRGAFDETPVEREILKKVINAGIWAPSGCNKQSTSFVAVDDPSIMDRIAEVIPTTTCRTAKAFIICVVDVRPVYGEFSFYKEDCSAAVENMLLALTALGFSTVWYDGVLRRDNNAEKIASILGIPAEKRVQVVLPIGVPCENIPLSTRFAFEERVFFNGWEKQI